MKRILTIALALLCALAAACGGAPQQDAAEPTAQEMQLVTATEAPAAATPEPTPEPTAAPTPEPERSSTSGKILSGSEVYRPAIVSIENAAGARPQTGLMEADIVYEFLVESNITRFQALYSDSVPTLVGPVRSARYYFIDLQQEWNGLYAHIGYTGLSGRYSRGWSDCPIHLSGGEWFDRIEKQGVSSVHSMYLYLADAIANEYGDHAPERQERFLFGEGVSYPDAQQVSRVDVPFTGSTDLYYTFDSASGRMLRFQDGKAFESLSGNDQSVREQVAVTNLIIQHCDYGLVPADLQPGENKGRRTVELTGTGACEYIINGRLLTGTWERETLEDYTRYYLDDGSLVTLEAGNTWIEVIPTSAEIVVS